MKHEVGGGGRALELRTAFDRAFAEPAVARSEDVENLLRIQVAGDDYALRLDDVAGLFADRKIAPLPSPASDLLGIAGLRGALVPVYGLRPLLGYPGGEPPRWIALVRTAAVVAVAFDAYGGHLRLARSDLAPALGEARGREHVHTTARADGLLLPVIDVLSLVKTLEGRAHRAAPWKER